MWTVPRLREDEDERCNRLIAQYEAQLINIEASKPTPWWDGFCGLVKVQDEDDVRPDDKPVAPAEAEQRQQAGTALPLAQQQQQQQQQQAVGRAPPAHVRQHRRQPSSGSTGTWGTATPPMGSSPRSSPRTSPFKPGPRATPLSQQPAAVMTERAARLLHHEGRLEEAQALLGAALRRCPLTDTQLAARVVDLALEAERERQQTPTHSRQVSGASLGEQLLQRASGGADGGAVWGVDGDVGGQLRQAVEALAAGEARRAEQLLLRALADCPADLPELRRRLELYLELVQCKRQQ